MTTSADTPRMAIVNKHSDRTLEVTDTCDRCGRQAYVQATMINGSVLLFCAHHGRRMMAAPKGKPDKPSRLMEEALVIDDYIPYLEGQETRTV